MQNEVYAPYLTACEHRLAVCAFPAPITPSQESCRILPDKANMVMFLQKYCGNLMLVCSIPRIPITLLLLVLNDCSCVLYVLVYFKYIVYFYFIKLLYKKQFLNVI